MVCSTAILSSSLALSLLRHSSLPSQSFVLSPFSLNTGLSIIHDGANGTTQNELTNLLLNGCSPSDVTNFYSSLVSTLTSTKGNGVLLKYANRFYVDERIPIKYEYQKHIAEKYKVKVEHLGLDNKTYVATKINKFVEEATNGKLKDAIPAKDISSEAAAILINAVYINGKWKNPFYSELNYQRTFKGYNGNVEMEFMNKYETYLRVNLNNDFGSLLILPFQDEKYNFFYIMPNEYSNLEKMRNELNGEKFSNLIKNSIVESVDITVPKFKVASQLDGVEVLKKMGIDTLFKSADLSKMTPLWLNVNNILHNVAIETNELGTEAAGYTHIELGVTSMFSYYTPPHIIIDRPFLFGILRDDNILFLGQFA